MKTQNGTYAQKTEQTNPFLNAAIIATVALAILPAAIFGAIRFVQARADAAAKDYEVKEATSKRSSVAERRAQRLEARKAKEAKAKEIYPEISMDTVEPYYDGFGAEYDADMEFNRVGMMPPAYMGGPGMMRIPDRGNFNVAGRMPGAEMGFNDQFGRGRGNF